MIKDRLKPGSGHWMKQGIKQSEQTLPVDLKPGTTSPAEFILWQQIAWGWEL
jgi:hypothetical protein